MNNGTGDTSATTLTPSTKTAAAGAAVAVRPNGRHGRHKQRYSSPEGMQLNVIGIPVRVKRKNRVEKKIEEEDEEELGREGGPIKFTISSVNTTTSAKPNADDAKTISCDDDDDNGHADVELELLLSTSLKKKIGVWSLPKGGWESDETVEEAVIRESFEESGVICKPFASALDKSHLSSSCGISLANLADEEGDSLPPTLPSPLLSSSTLTSWWTSLQDRYTAHLEEVVKDGSKRVLEENFNFLSFVDNNYTKKYDYHHHLSSLSSTSASAPSGEETPATSISKKQMMSSRTWMFPFVIRQEPRGFDPVKNKDQVGKLHHIFPVLVTDVLPDESYPQGDVRRREWITVAAKKLAKKKTKRESSSFARSPESLALHPLLSQVRPDQRIVIQTMTDAGLFDEILLHNS